MKLGFSEDAARYESASQTARSLTETWAATHLFCPACGADRLNKLPNNAPVADFECAACSEQFELKAKKGPFGRKVVDGAYATMRARLAARDNPNLALMSYDSRASAVRSLIVVPKHFFVPEIIEERPPLAPTARRAGWIGCNIRLDRIPDSGRIFLVRDGAVVAREHALSQWRRTRFLATIRDESRGWLIETMACVERIGRSAFTLQDVYAWEAHLGALFPGNRHVREKIRQQLQRLRDNGYLRFTGNGSYELVRP